MEALMIILEWIDYGFIVVFFLLVGALIVMIAGPRDARAADEKEPAARKEKLAASFVLAGLFLFFLCLTVLSSRRSNSG